MRKLKNVIAAAALMLSTVCAFHNIAAPQVAFADEATETESGESTEETTGDTTGDTPTVVIATETEPNDTVEKANALTDTITGVSQDLDDVDWYVYTAAAKGYVSFSFQGINAPDAVWYVSGYYNEITDTSGISKVYDSAVPVKTGDKIYIKISNSNESEDEFYKLSFNFVADDKVEIEYNDNTENAIKIADDVKGTILNENDVDWYVYTATAEGYLEIDFNKDVVTDSKWKVYGYFNSIVSSANLFSWSNGIQSMSHPAIPMQAGDKVYIQIASGTSTAGKLYQIHVKFTADSNMEAEYNNSSDTATKFTDKVKGTLINDNDVDWYVYIAKEEGYVYFDFKRLGENEATWKVNGYLNEVLDLSKIQSLLISPMPVQPGQKIYIQITKDRDSIDRLYELSARFTADSNMEAEFNNYSNLANVIKDEVKGTTYNLKDNDYYEYTVPDEGYV